MFCNTCSRFCELCQYCSCLHDNPGQGGKSTVATSWRTSSRCCSKYVFSGCGLRDVDIMLILYGLWSLRLMGWVIEGMRQSWVWQVVVYDGFVYSKAASRRTWMVKRARALRSFPPRPPLHLTQSLSAISAFSLFPRHHSSGRVRHARASHIDTSAEILNS